MNKPKQISKLNSKRASTTVNSSNQELLDSTSLPGTLLEIGCRELQPHQMKIVVSDSWNRDLDMDNIEQLMLDKNHVKDPLDYPFSEPAVGWWDAENGQLVLKDGNHRAHVCRRLGTKFRFTIVQENYSIFNGKRSDKMAWRVTDLVHSYAKAGFDAYVQLVKLLDLYPHYPFPTLTLFFNGNMTSARKLRYREFEIKEQFPQSRLNPDGTLTAFELAEIRLKMFERFNVSAQRKDYPKELIKNLIIAFERPEFDFEYFIKRTTANAPAAALRPELSQSISTNVRARYLIQFYYNENSKSHVFYF